MVSIRRKILYKGTIVQEQLLNVLQRHEDNLGGSSGSSLSDLQTTVQTLDTEVNGTNQEGTLAYKVGELERRIKALEDAE